MKMNDLFKCCQCKHEINEKEFWIKLRNFEEHFKVKDRLIKNLECIIDQQEGQIRELQMRFENQLGIKLAENTEQHVLKGISYLSLDFGSLSEENLELKNAFAASEKRNRVLEIKLNDSLFSSTIPILVDNETQTYDSEVEVLDLKKTIFDPELNDTGFESEDGSDTPESECNSLVPVDPIPVQNGKDLTRTCISQNLVETIHSLVNENNALKEAYLKYESDTSSQLIQFKNSIWKHVVEFFQRYEERFIQRYEEEVQLRKALHDALVELRGNIRVFCRLRPILSSEKVQPNLILHDKLSDAINVKMENGVKKFLFDRIFDQEHTQMDIFEEICPLIHSCLDGKNLTIFAYGHTGSGKTYSMEGPEENPGIGRRALMEIFDQLEQRSDQFSSEVFISLIEIYNEKIRDLLNPQCSNIALKLDEEGNQAIKGITRQKVESEAKISEILSQGRQNRSVASTALNDNSSRSHAIAVITVKMKDLTSGKLSIGKLNLVDLAGSERVTKSQVSGPQLKEAQFINRSLSELGNVVSALRKKQNHVPFRNCLLTRILEDSLAGDGKTVMIVQVTSTQNFLQESLKGQLASVRQGRKMAAKTHRIEERPWFI